MLNAYVTGQRFAAGAWLAAAVLISGCPSGSGHQAAQAPQAAQSAAQSQHEESGAEVSRGAAGADRQAAGNSSAPAPQQAPTAGGAAAGERARWWGEGSDPHRQNCTPNRGPAQPSLRWSCKLGRNFNGKLVLAGDTIVAGLIKASKRIGFILPEDRYAIDLDGLPDQVAAGEVVGVAADGSVAWRRETKGAPLLCAALVPDPRVYSQCWWRRFEDVRRRGNQPKTLTMLRSELAALDPTGHELWALEEDGAPLGEPLVTGDGEVHYLAVWRENIYHNGKYYDHSLTRAGLVCYDPDGRENWRYPLSHFDNCWELTPACQIGLLPSGSIGFSWNDNVFRAFKPDGGKDWVYGMRSVPDGPPAASPTGDIVLLANDRPTLTEKQLDIMNWEAMNKYGVLHVLRGVGTLRWEVQPGSDVHSAVAIDAAGVIHFGTTFYEQDRDHRAKNGRVYAITPDKQLLWQYDTHARFEDTPLQPDPLVDGAGVLYISDAGRHLYALNLDGSLKWEYASPQGFATNPVIAPDGTLYIGGNDGKLYALGG